MQEAASESTEWETTLVHMKEQTGMCDETFTPDEYAGYFYFMGSYPDYLEPILSIEEEDVLPSSWEAVPAYLEKHAEVGTWCLNFIAMLSPVIGDVRFVQGTVPTFLPFTEKDRDAQIVHRVRQVLIQCVHDTGFDGCFSEEARLRLSYAFIITLFFAMFLPDVRVVETFRETLRSFGVSLDSDTIASINTWRQTLEDLPRKAVMAIGACMLRNVVARTKEYLFVAC